MSDARAAWAGLSAPWEAALEEAWASWCAGSFGIGAALADGEGTVVSRGRNRANEQRAEAGVLAGNFTAHAEMNAFAALRRWDASGLHLYTTLEPCLMCAAAALTQRVAAMHLAAPDALFAGLDELWPLHPVTAARQPPRTGPLEGRLAAFAQLLPWSLILLWAPGGPPAATYRDADPALADLAAAIPLGGPLLDAKTAGASAGAALAAIWADLPESRQPTVRRRRLSSGRGMAAPTRPAVESRHS